ncbi:Cryptochrome-1 [Cyanidiococcus yangmingshanensis]|uniref:Cryptochrome-1 n=1 Tax=Cyanidiococcus yangmingshanensis TaxID=2690220 RepID=A0A7J7IIK8_9RHOD|nr:Cryptochrome-1 [Cyanidiococcus yangmingshanensis]
MTTMSNASAAYPYASYMPAHGTRSLAVAAAAAAAAAAASGQPSIVGSAGYAGAVASSPSAQHHFSGLSYGHGGALPTQVPLTLQPQAENNRPMMGMIAGAAGAGHTPDRTAQSALTRATASPGAGLEPGVPKRSGQVLADRGSSGAVYQTADGNDRGFVHSRVEAHPLPNEDKDRTTLTSVGGRKRYSSGLMVAGSGDQLDADIAAQSQRTPWSDSQCETEGVLTIAKPKRRAAAVGRNRNAQDTSPSAGVSSDQSKAVASRATVSRRRERGLENESIEMRSSSASSERVALQPLADLATAEPPSNRTERLLLLERICRSDSEFARFAEYLLRNYDITENVRRDAQSTDFVRLRNIKDDFHRYCTSLAPEASGDRERLKIYRIKLFFSKVLNLEVTGEWDRHAHGGVRGPYVYGLVARSNLTP